ncbi:MAG: hypothetical protein WC477_07180 [Patescibacteria group bacterium]
MKHIDVRIEWDEKKHVGLLPCNIQHVLNEYHCEDNMFTVTELPGQEDGVAQIEGIIKKILTSEPTEEEEKRDAALLRKIVKRREELRKKYCKPDNEQGEKEAT